MERIWVDARARELCKFTGVDTHAGLQQLMGKPDSRTTVRVVQRELPGPGGSRTPVFCKLYNFSPPSWRFLGRPSKARREFENYALFESLGIRCARRLACSEFRDRLGRLREAFLLTEAVPDTVTLAEFARLPQKTSRAAHRHVCLQLAEMTRRLHDGGAFHNDLYWRNVLVQFPHAERPVLWWIDCPRGGRVRFPALRRRAQLKDLAALLKDSDGLCGQKDRVRFLKQYLGVKKLDAPAKALLRRVAAYRARRWPASR